MYSILLNWKETNFLLNDIEAWMRTNAGDRYTGNSAGSDGLMLWFLSEPPLSVKESIQQYWDGLGPGSPEAVRYMSNELMAQKVTTAKAGLISKTWDQMNTAERKIILGVPLVREDYDQLV